VNLIPAPLLAATLWESLLWLAGYNDLRDLPPGGKVQLELTNLPTSWVVFVLIAVIAALLYAIYYLYRREMAGCPTWVKMVLATIRAAAMLLLVFILLNPALIYYRYRTDHPALIVARDASLSMNTRDSYQDPSAATSVAKLLGKSPEDIRKQKPTRVEIVNKALTRDNLKFLAALSARGKVRALNFSDHVDKVDARAAKTESTKGVKSEMGQPREAEEPTIKPLPELTADGPGTDIWGAIREALATESPSAIVMFTDGQHTGKDDPRAAAREARDRGIPLLIVGVGDPSRPRNLKATDLYVRQQVWQDEPFEIDAMVVAQGLEAREVRVELIEQKISDADGTAGPGTVVATQQLAIPEAGGRMRVQFSHSVKESGKFKYTVKVETVDDELDEADNETPSAEAKVLSRERVRVLLVAGAPTWEFRLVQKLLARDKTITVSCWLQTLDEERAQEGTRQITRLPITKEEMFYYDVVMLFDPNPQEFDAPWVELLKSFVGEHSGGLLFMAGPKHSGRMLTSPRTSEMQKLMPVSFGDVGALEIAALLSTNQRAWPLKVVAANADHPVMRFYPDRAETLQRWETLPGIFWSFPSQEPKPAATVLLEHSDPTLRSVEGSRPLLVAGRYGSGHTLYLGFNGTWRWRRAGRQAEFFDKFWIQSVRYLVEGRSLEGRRRGYVQADRDRYEVGERITVTSRLQDAAYNPLVAPKAEATLQVGSESPEAVILMPVSNQPGTFAATLTAKKTGRHSLRVRTAVAEAEGATIETSFDVVLPSVETNQVWLDEPLLRELAETSSGKYFNIDQLDQLASAVPDKTRQIEVRDPPDPLWDVRGMMFLLVGLLGVEWVARKRYKLL
jgi:von Willebrand factor type A domain